MRPGQKRKSHMSCLVISLSTIEVVNSCKVNKSFEAFEHIEIQTFRVYHQDCNWKNNHSKHLASVLQANWKSYPDLPPEKDW